MTPNWFFSRLTYTRVQPYTISSKEPSNSKCIGKWLSHTSATTRGQARTRTQK